MLNAKTLARVAGALALSLVPWTAACRCRSPAKALDPRLIPLQGHWEGEGAGGKCSLTITGDSLNYQAGTNWWKTTFTLPANTNPQQLHATIKASSPPTNGVGTVVFAIFRIEDRVLTLAETDGSDEAPESFDAASSRYVLKKVERQR